jgi:PPOX class probable F420-dependent enzyme
MLDPDSVKDARIDARLRSEPIIWLATTRPDGRPHLVPVWFWWDGSRVLIFSEPDNQKVRNLRRSPHAMLALDTADQGEDVVMIAGEAELLAEPATATMPAGFADKYASLFARLGSSAAEMAARYSQPIRVTPSKFIAW